MMDSCPQRANQDSWKRKLKKCVLASSIFNVASYLRKPGVAILMYHSIKENPSELDDIIGSGLAHSAALFDQQMKLLARDCQPVDMDDIVDFAVRRVKIPHRAVAVTFDDGFADNYTVAAPIMSNHGIRGAFYVTTGSIAPEVPPWFYLVRRALHLTRHPHWVDPRDGSLHDLAMAEGRNRAMLRACEYYATADRAIQRDWISVLEDTLDVPSFRDGADLMMNESQIRGLAAGGHIVGSHSVSHPNIAWIPAEQVDWELNESRRVLESILDTPVRHFSYPSPVLRPNYSALTMQKSREAGYSTGLTCTRGLFVVGDDPLACRRIGAPGNLTDFRWRLERTFAHGAREALFATS